MNLRLPTRWILLLSAKARCATCGAWTPLDGPDPRFACRICSETTTLPADTWRQALGPALVEARSWSEGDRDWRLDDPDDDPPLRTRWERSSPRCPSCRTELGAEVLFADEPACPRCELVLPVEPADPDVRALAPRVRWVLRIPRSPAEEEELQRRERRALAEVAMASGFERDPLGDHLAGGHHVPSGRSFVGLAVDTEEEVAVRQRVEAALSETRAALEEAGWSLAEDLHDLPGLPAAPDRAEPALAPSTEPAPTPEGDEEGSALLGCLVLAGLAGGLVLAGVAIAVVGMGAMFVLGLLIATA